MSGWRHAGYSDPVPGWCERPSKLVNVHSGEWHLSRCRSARSSRCAPCAEIKRADIAAVGRSGWTDRPSDLAFFVTLTAPGQDVLPWDTAHCRHSAGVKCSGKIGCQVEAHALALWHDDIGIRLSRVFEDVRRALNPGETALPVSRRSRRVEYMRTYEPQSRGALHAHIMTRLEGAPVSTATFLEVFDQARKAHGFGSELRVDLVDLADPVNAARAAGYVAKYNSKSADSLPSVCRLNRATGQLRYGGLRSWSASRQWGLTMKAIHARRCAWAAAAAALPAAGDPTGGGVVAAGAGAGGALDPNQNHSASGSVCSVDLTAALV